MTVALKNNKKSKHALEAERLARSQGVKPFSIRDAIQDRSITDEELEEFLSWRREIRDAGVEAQKSEFVVRIEY